MERRVVLAPAAGQQCRVLSDAAVFPAFGFFLLPQEVSLLLYTHCKSSGKRPGCRLPSCAAFVQREQAMRRAAPPVRSDLAG